MPKGFQESNPYREVKAGASQTCPKHACKGVNIATGRPDCCNDCSHTDALEREIHYPPHCSGLLEEQTGDLSGISGFNACTLEHIALVLALS